MYQPAGWTPVSELGDTDLQAYGFDPLTTRAMAAEYAQVGQTLGIRLPGVLRKVGRAVGRGARFVVQRAVPTVARAAIRVAPVAVPAGLALKFGPGLVRKAAGVFRKPPARLTEAEVRAAARVPVVAAPPPVPAVAPASIPRRRRRPPVLKVAEKVREEALRVAPALLPALMPAAVEPTPPPTVAPAAEAPPVPAMVEPGAPPTITAAAVPGLPGRLPGWALPALVGVGAMLMFGGRRGTGRNPPRRRRRRRR